MKAIVVGKKVNTGRDGKIYRTLYVLKDAPKHLVDGFEGQSVEAVSVPFDIPSGVGVNVYCDFEYDSNPTRNGNYSVLVDITPLKRVIVETRELK